jgi:hypothetical protein
MKRLLSACSILLCACGGDPVDPPNRTELTVVKAAGSPSTFASSEALTAGGTVEAIGISGEGRVLVVFDAQVHELSSGLFEPRSLYVGEGDPAALGTVHRIAPRLGGGAWVATEAGLFAVDELYTYKVPLLEDAGAMHDAIEVGSGALSGLWLATEAGLHHRDGDEVYQYAIEGLTGAATDVAIAGSGTFGVALIGGVIATLEPSGGQILVDRPPLDTGAIHALAAGADAIYAATEKGIFAFTAGATPPWTQYTLSESGAIEVLALSIDAPKNAVWARTADSMVLLENGSITVFPMAPASQMSLLAIDSFGDVWTASGDALSKSTTSVSTETATFTEHVLPWIQERCSMCHMNQTQNFEDYSTFVEVAENALTRVRSGDMPRCDGGLRCPSEQRLPEDDYAVLEQWIRDGMPE